MKWKCIDVGGGFEDVDVQRGATGKAFRVLQCTPAHNPNATPRQIRVPAEIDLEDPSVQHWVLWTARKFG